MQVCFKDFGGRLGLASSYTIFFFYIPTLIVGRTNLSIIRFPALTILAWKHFKDLKEEVFFTMLCMMQVVKNKSAGKRLNPPSAAYFEPRKSIYVYYSYFLSAIINFQRV